MLMNQINIPLACPSCDGNMYDESYDTPLKNLKERSWQVCKECGFEQSTDDFKKELWTV